MFGRRNGSYHSPLTLVNRRIFRLSGVFPLSRLVSSGPKATLQISVT